MDGSLSVCSDRFVFSLRIGPRDFIAMTRFWFYICTLVVIQCALFIVGHAMVVRGTLLTNCCNVEKTRATYKHEDSINRLLKECDQELGKIFHFVIVMNRTKWPNSFHNLQMIQINIIQKSQRVW